MKRFPGYTLLELMIGIVLFSGLLATIFSVFSTIRRAERFRDENIRLTQAASYSFEPMVRAIKLANAIEEIKPDNNQADRYGLPQGYTCVSARGFYGQRSGLTQPTIIDDGTMNAVAVTAEKTFDPTNGETYKWVKHIYEWQTIDNTLVETREEIIDKSRYGWPRPLNSCNEEIWEPVGDKRVLTPNDVEVKNFQVDVVAPILTNANAPLGSPVNYLRSPYITISLTLGYPGTKGAIAPPVTFTSTIVPTFTYGEQRE